MKKRAARSGINLSVNVAGIEMKNPVMCASGTFGFGEEYSKLFDIKKLGAIVTKTITLKPREGNPPPRIKETSSGMLNSIGLQNPGVRVFKAEKLPFLRALKIPVIVSIAGETVREYANIAGSISGEKGIAAIEVNISCPNVKPHAQRTGPSGRRLLFSQDTKATASVVGTVRKATDLPIIVKLSPNVANIGDFAAVSEDCGANAVSLINTPIGMAVDLKERRPCLSNVMGGLSGPAIKPIALRMVWQAYNRVKIPIIGMGGIMNAVDALEFILCGASAVAVGTANFVKPAVIPEIIKGMKEHMKKHGIKDINKLRGALNVREAS